MITRAPALLNDLGMVVGADEILRAYVDMLEEIVTKAFEVNHGEGVLISGHTCPAK
jgi:hypothetical protein